MIPYASFLYFAVTGLYILLPVLLLCSVRAATAAWLKKACIVFATVVMLVVQYYPPFNEKAALPFRQIWAVAIFLLLQYLLARVLLTCRLRSKAKWPGYMAVSLSILPLLAAKFLPANFGASAGEPVGAVGATGLVEFIGLC